MTRNWLLGTTSACNQGRYRSCQITEMRPASLATDLLMSSLCIGEKWVSWHHDMPRPHVADAGDMTQTTAANKINMSPQNIRESRNVTQGFIQTGSEPYKMYVTFETWTSRFSKRPVHGKELQSGSEIYWKCRRSRGTGVALKQQAIIRLFYKLNSVALVRKRTIPTERPQPAGEVSANFSW
jgi:hypothetical protein